MPALTHPLYGRLTSSVAVSTQTIDTSVALTNTVGSLYVSIRKDKESVAVTELDSLLTRVQPYKLVTMS